MISISPTMEPKLHLMKGVRGSLLHYLKVVLGDDELDAHFMLLHLLSKVHSRVDSIAVGKLSLNLTSFDKSSISVFGNRINNAVKTLLPFTHHMPLTVEDLNIALLATVKDYQTNRITRKLHEGQNGHFT